MLYEKLVVLQGRAKLPKKSDDVWNYYAHEIPEECRRGFKVGYAREWGTAVTKITFRFEDGGDGDGVK